MDRRILAKLFISVWVVYLFHIGSMGEPGGRFNALSMSIVQDGNLSVGEFKEEGLKDAFNHEGRYYINTNPGVSFLAAPFWGIAYTAYRMIPESSVIRSPVVRSKLSEFTGYASTSSLFSALCATLIAAYVYRVSKSEYRAIFSSLLFSFGTISFRLSQGLNNNQNVVVASICFIIFSLIFKPRIFPKWIQDRRFTVMGLMGGMGILVDLSMAPFLAITFIPALRKASDKGKVTRLLVSGLVPLLGLAAYLQTVFGSPLLPPQAYAPSEIHSGPGSGLAGATLPDLGVMVSHLVSLDKGLLTYMPFTIILLLYLIPCSLLFYRRNNFNLASKYSIYVLAVYILLSGSLSSSKFNIFGPRYLLPAVPFLCVSFVLLLRRRHLFIAVPLTAASFYINIGGAQLGIGSPNAGFIAALYALRGPWFPILDWIEKDLSSVMSTPEIITPYGLLILIILTMTVIWFPYFKVTNSNSNIST